MKKLKGAIRANTVFPASKMQLDVFFCQTTPRVSAAGQMVVCMNLGTAVLRDVCPPFSFVEIIFNIIYIVELR